MMMVYEALLAAHERPPTLREVKRALLTYDRVVIADPDDRDMMPSNTFWTAISGMPLFGIDTGAVRPLPKVRGYDDDFTELLDICSKPIEQGLLEVRSTYTKQQPGIMTLGSVDTGGYPLNFQFVFWLYRSMASDQGFLRSALANSDDSLLTDSALLHELAVQGVGDGSINDIPVLPSIEGVDDSERALALAQVARGRLGAFIKYAGYSEVKNLVPVFPSGVYGDIAIRLANNARDVLNLDSAEPFWAHRSRVLDLCHEEYLVDAALDSMSVQDVLRLRTVAWGKQAAAREALFQSVFALASEFGGKAEFEERARALIADYRKASEELLRERRKLGLQIKCELGSGVLGAGVYVAGLLSQLELPAGSVGLALAAGGIWALQRTKEIVPELHELKAREQEMKRGAAIGIHDFYSRIPSRA